MSQIDRFDEWMAEDGQSPTVVFAGAEVSTRTRVPKPYFTDSPYRRSHMVAPRGRGSWAFQVARSEVAFDRDLVGDVVFSPGGMTLTEAKRWATVVFDGAAIVAVLP